MTEQEYIENLLTQIANLQEDNLKIRRANSKLKKSERHLRRVIKSYKDEQAENRKQHYRNGQKRGRTRNG